MLNRLETLRIKSVSAERNLLRRSLGSSRIRFCGVRHRYRPRKFILILGTANAILRNIFDLVLRHIQQAKAFSPDSMDSGFSSMRSCRNQFISAAVTNVPRERRAANSSSVD
jgi:hypothetical protein